LARKKNADGQGTIRKVLRKDGTVERWRWEVMVGLLPDGGRDIRRGSAKTEREAAKALRKVLAAKDGGRLPSATATRDTVADHVRRWLETIRHELDRKSWQREEQNVNLHIVPALGKAKLANLTPANVREFLASRSASGLSPATVKYIRGTLARALDQALVDGIVPVNVARVERRKRRSKSSRGAVAQKHTFTPADVHDIHEGTTGDRFHALWMLLLYTGMREGEAFALTWRDLDPHARTLSIRATLEGTANGHPILSDPKTYASQRTLVLPRTVVDLLLVHRATQAQEKLDARVARPDGTITNQYLDHGLIFCSRWGTPLMASNLILSFHRLMKRLGLPERLTPHTCRHTCATNMLYAGVPLPEVSYILGHASVEITAKTYSHALPRGGAGAWTPPPGLRGLDLLEAWYARAQVMSDLTVPPAVPPEPDIMAISARPADLEPALPRYN
jgi:integrase